MTIERPDVCPRCGAQPGHGCVTAAGYPANTHAARHPDAPRRGWEEGGALRLAYEAERRERDERREREAKAWAERIDREALAWADRLGDALSCFPPFTPDEITEVARLVAELDARRVARREARSAFHDDLRFLVADHYRNAGRRAGSRSAIADAIDEGYDTVVRHIDDVGRDWPGDWRVIEKIVNYCGGDVDHFRKLFIAAGWEIQ